MRNQRQSSHKWHQVKEKQQVSGKGAVDRLVQAKLHVRPDQHTRKPERASKRQKHPESVAPPVWRSRIEQQASVCKQRYAAFQKVAERGQGLAVRKQQRSRCVSTDEKYPGAENQRGRTRELHAEGTKENCTVKSGFGEANLGKAFQTNNMGRAGRMGVQALGRLLRLHYVYPVPIALRCMFQE